MIARGGDAIPFKRSGKSTALALLFAVFEARPSPFCMLDGYRGSTQFVVVTHNKATMTACESLYGVTMETKGVSRQVSVELGDVDRWVGGAASVPAASAQAEGGARVARSAAPRRALDAESGEPVVELIPRRAEEAPGEPGGAEADALVLESSPSAPLEQPG